MSNEESPETNETRSFLETLSDSELADILLLLVSPAVHADHEHRAIVGEAVTRLRGSR